MKFDKIRQRMVGILSGALAGGMILGAFPVTLHAEEAVSVMADEYLQIYETDTRMPLYYAGLLDFKTQITGNGKDSAYFLKVTNIADLLKDEIKNVVFYVSPEGEDAVVAYPSLCKDVDGNYMTVLQTKELGGNGTYTVEPVIVLQNSYTIHLTPEKLTISNYKELDDEGSVFSVMGDSLSTYLGYTSTDRGECYYRPDTMDIDLMWWSQFRDRDFMTIGTINAVGGTRVTWDGVTESDYYHWGKNYCMASDVRIQALDDEGEPNMILFFGGLNDLLSGGAVAYGDAKNVTFNKVDTMADAYWTAMMKLQFYYPDAEILVMIPYDTWATDGTITDPLADIIMEEARYFDFKIVDLRLSAIDGQKDMAGPDYLHPNESGMTKIVQCIERTLGIDAQMGEGFRKDWRGVERYYDADGKLVKDKFVQYKGDTYYIDKDSMAVQDTLKYSSDGKHVIYFDEEGRQAFDRLVHVTKSIKGDKIDAFYYFDKDGYQCFKKLVYADDANGKKQAYYVNEYGVAETDGIFTYADNRGKGFARKDGSLVQNDFVTDGTYTYYIQADYTAMTDRLTYHPDGKHIIYFDKDGHECFDRFANVKKSIAGEDVDDMCYFNTFGYMYVDETTFVTAEDGSQKAYYLNAYGVMQTGGWFTFADGVNIGYANEDGTLKFSCFDKDAQGRTVYFQADGRIARGTIFDGVYHYDFDETDGHLLRKY